MDNKKLKDLLEHHHTWPCVYTFKFIVPISSGPDLEKVLKGHEILKKNSKKGNYLSVTAKKTMNSSEEVMDVYAAVSQIKGVISL